MFLTKTTNSSNRVKNVDSLGTVLKYDRILILIIVTNREFKESYEKEVFRHLKNQQGALK